MPSSPPNSPEDLQSTTTVSSPDGSKRLRVGVVCKENDDDKENVLVKSPVVINAKKSVPPPPVLAVQEPPQEVYASKSRSSCSSSTSSMSDENDDSGIRDDINEDDDEDDYLAANEEEDDGEEDEEKDKPKVIVEHQPLPSIYELQQMTCENLNESNDQCLDSGLSEDDSGSGSEDDSDGDVDSMISSPLFDPVLRGTPGKAPIITPPTPKVIYNDRFWNQGSFGAQNTPQPPPLPPTPPPATSIQSSNPAFGFLETSNQRIECAENGKSYLQLGTINHHHHHHHHHNHHHIPVTPVIQPKSNMVYRRPIPPFRSPPGIQQHQVQLQAARPVCDHSDCLQRKSSFCYKNQRSRMLNLSLHKLHMARQNHEGCLRRSVLICNMLRYIEDENEKEALQETLAPPQTGPLMDTTTTEQYWPPPTTHAGPATGPGGPAQPQSSCSSPQTPTTTTDSYMASNSNSNSYMQSQSGQQFTQSPTGQVPTSTPGTDTYETALKDFNTAFRSTPYSSPLHPGGSDSDLGTSTLNGTTDVGLSLSLTYTTSSLSSTTSGQDDRSTGINWGSVLSLSSQSELDPLNNNSFNTDSTSVWNQPTTTSSITTMPAASSCSAVTAEQTTTTTTTSSSLTTLSPLSGVEDNGEDLVHSFVDDIGWKLSADDVLKAFPT